MSEIQLIEMRATSIREDMNQLSHCYHGDESTT